MPTTALCFPYLSSIFNFKFQLTGWFPANGFVLTFTQHNNGALDSSPNIRYSFPTTLCHQQVAALRRPTLIAQYSNKMAWQQLWLGTWYCCSRITVAFNMVFIATIIVYKNRQALIDFGQQTQSKYIQPISYPTVWPTTLFYWAWLI